jgi:hypothetical protein
MATEKQIAANRANAKMSTGPKTALGKQKSSRNAYRHGLSCPLRLDPETSAKAHAMVRTLVGEGPDPEKLMWAEEFARAQLELHRIRSMRADLMTKVDPKYVDASELQSLVVLDRYERYAHTRGRRAAEKF